MAATNVSASKQFYVEHGLSVEKSFLNKYVQFDASSGSVKLALYGRRALAKDAGIAPKGTGSHRIVMTSDAGPFSDPDGFLWEAAPCTQSTLQDQGEKR